MNELNNYKRYDDWMKLNNFEGSGNPHLLNYIFQVVHPHDFLILSKLFVPEIINRNGMLFLEFLFDEDLFLNLKSKMKDQEIQKNINRIHIYDLLAPRPDTTESDYVAIANVLRIIWEAQFRSRFPQVEMKVEIIISEFEYGPIIVCHQL